LIETSYVGLGKAKWDEEEKPDSTMFWKSGSRIFKDNIQKRWL